MTTESPESVDRKPAAPFARPLAFTILLLYGLMTFAIGMKDYRDIHRLETWVAIVMILTGVLLGSTAIRVLLRRYRAFNRTVVGVTVLVITNCFSTLVPGLPRDWREIAVRVVLSALILFLVRRSDKAILPRPLKPESQGEDESRETSE